MDAIKIFSVIVIALFLIPFISAAKVETDLSLTAQCTNSTYANITYAKYISTSQYLINSDRVMTKNGIFYNYTIPSVNNTIVGTLEYGYRCDVNGIDTSAGNTIFISLMGEELGTGQGILYIVMVLGLLVIFVLTLIGAFAFPWRQPTDEEGNTIGINDFRYLKVLLFVFSYLEFLFIVAIFRNLSGYLLVEGTYAFLNIFYFIMLIALIPFLPLLVFFTIMIWINNKKTLRAIEMGLPTG